MTNTFDKELLRSRVADKLVAMEKMFDSRCKLTFVMRAPHLPDGDMIVTADNVDAVITALQRLRGYEEIKAPELAAAASDDGAARQQEDKCAKCGAIVRPDPRCGGCGASLAVGQAEEDDPAPECGQCGVPVMDNADIRCADCLDAALSSPSVADSPTCQREIMRSADDSAAYLRVKCTCGKCPSTPAGAK